MPAQSWRQLSALRSPANQDTTCRVRRQSATHTHQALDGRPQLVQLQNVFRLGRHQKLFLRAANVGLFLTMPLRSDGQPRRCALIRVGWNARGKPSEFRISVLRCSHNREPAYRNSRRLWQRSFCLPALVLPLRVSLPLPQQVWVSIIMLPILHNTVKLQPLPNYSLREL